MYLIKYDDQELSIKSDILTSFMSKLTNKSFSSNHIKGNVIEVSQETFGHIQNYCNITSPEYYDYQEIKDTCDYLNEDTETVMTKYLKSLTRHKKNIYQQSLSSINYDNLMIKIRLYDANPADCFSKITKYFLKHDPENYFDILLSKNNIVDTRIILQWITVYINCDAEWRRDKFEWINKYNYCKKLELESITFEGNKYVCHENNKYINGSTNQTIVLGIYKNNCDIGIKNNEDKFIYICCGIECGFGLPNIIRMDCGTVIELQYEY
jgi:hypothetical protein